MIAPFRFWGPVSFDIRSDVGGITVRVGSSECVQIHAALKAHYGPVDLARAEEHIRALEQNPPVEQTGNRIRIGYPKDPSLLKGVSMHLDIEAPQESQIQARTTSGGIRIDGIHGPVQAQTHSGGLEIQAISNDVRANALWGYSHSESRWTSFCSERFRGHPGC